MRLRLAAAWPHRGAACHRQPPVHGHGDPGRGGNPQQLLPRQRQDPDPSQPGTGLGHPFREQGARGPAPQLLEDPQVPHLRGDRGPRQGGGQRSTQRGPAPRRRGTSTC